MYALTLHEIFGDGEDWFFVTPQVLAHSVVDEQMSTSQSKGTARHMLLPRTQLQFENIGQTLLTKKLNVYPCIVCFMYKGVSLKRKSIINCLYILFIKGFKSNLNQGSDLFLLIKAQGKSR